MRAIKLRESLVCCKWYLPNTRIPRYEQGKGFKKWVIECKEKMDYYGLPNVPITRVKKVIIEIGYTSLCYMSAKPLQRGDKVYRMLQLIGLIAEGSYQICHNMEVQNRYHKDFSYINITVYFDVLGSYHKANSKVDLETLPILFPPTKII